MSRERDVAADSVWAWTTRRGEPEASVGEVRHRPKTPILSLFEHRLTRQRLEDERDQRDVGHVVLRHDFPEPARGELRLEDDRAGRPSVDQVDQLWALTWKKGR